MTTVPARFRRLSRLDLAIAGSAALTIALPLAVPVIAWTAYVFTPLTTVLLLVLALRAPPSRAAGYRRAVAAGLAASLVGDICLMLPGDYFRAGLLSFLVAQGAYLVAFTRDSRFAARPLPFAVAGAMGTAVLAALWSGIAGPLRLLVPLYAATLLAMAAQAASRALHLQNAPARAAACGALLFVLSDTLLAWNRFGPPLPASRILVLTSYFTAQWLISSSAWPIPPTERKQ